MCGNFINGFIIVLQLSTIVTEQDVVCLSSFYLPNRNRVKKCSTKLSIPGVVFVKSKMKHLKDMGDPQWLNRAI